MANELEIPEAKEVLLNSEAKLKWHNNMVEAHFSATSREMRMLVALSAHIDKNGDDFEYCTVSARDLGKLMNLDPDGAYNILQDTVGKLFNKPIVFKSLEKTKDGKPKKVELYHIFYRLTYDNEHSAIGYQFSPAVKPLLLQVKSAYVETAIDTFMQFRCSYSGRIYMHVVQWSKLGTYIIPIAELREQFALGKTYPLFADFKRFVVEPALGEINAFSQYNVKVDYIKTGRKYTHVKFDISQKAGEKPPIDTTVTTQAPKKRQKQKKQDEPELTEEQQKIYKKLEQAGIADAEFIKKSVLSLSVEYIKVNYDYCYQKQLEGSVKNLGAYLRQALEKNYAQYGQTAPKKNKKCMGVPEPVVPTISPEYIEGDEQAELIKKEKNIKIQIEFEFLAMDDLLRAKTLDEIKDAVEHEQRPDVKGRYLDILDMTPLDFGEPTKRNIVACYLYRMRYPDANPLVEPDFKPPEVPPEVNKAFEKVNELAAKMDMLK